MILYVSRFLDQGVYVFHHSSLTFSGAPKHQENIFLLYKPIFLKVLLLNHLKVANHDIKNPAAPVQKEGTKQASAFLSCEVVSNFSDLMALVGRVRQLVPTIPTKSLGS